MKKLVEQWCESYPFTNEEKEIFLKPENSIYFDWINEIEYDHMKKMFLARLPYSKIDKNNCEISFDVSETSIINKIKDEFVDDDTIVITTDQEHPSVLKMVQSCKNYYIMKYQVEVIWMQYNDLIDKIKDFKKVVVIINGVKVATGEFTPQLFFIKLKNILRNKKSIIILDDAQGMFLHKRDYSIFDYVFGTCHAMIDAYDAGICISIGNNKPLGTKAYAIGLNYLYSLDLILARIDKLNIFSNIMEEYFYDKIVEQKLFNLDNTIHSRRVPYLFDLDDKLKIFTETQMELLNKHKISVDGFGTQQHTLRFRGHQYLDQPELLLKGLDIIQTILENV